MTPFAIEAIVIGGSSGALDALITILGALPDGLSTPIAIVIHQTPDHPSALAQVLRDVFGAASGLSVKEAEDKEPVRVGLFLAPPNYHLLIERERHFSLSADEPVHFSRPAIDVLFESAAEAYGRGLIGILLSGASTDGADGLVSIHQHGGKTIVQSPASASAQTMPRAALARLTPDHIGSPAEIGALLAALARTTPHRTEGP